MPAVQFILCEPFILAVGKVKDKWDDYSTELKKRQASVLRLSQEFDAIFVSFQSAFDKALPRAPAEYWIWDGIHPMPAGHELMAREWLHHVSKKLKFVKLVYNTKGPFRSLKRGPQLIIVVTFLTYPDLIKSKH